MSTLIVKRNARARGPQPPEGRVELAQPPVMPEAASADLSSSMNFLPMAMFGNSCLKLDNG